MNKQNMSLACAGAIDIANSPKINDRQRHVIVTNGSMPTMLVTSGISEVQYISVPYMNPNRIIDSCAAGDAFVGGFLDQLAEGRGIRRCVEMGHETAQKILLVSGCDVKSL